MNVFWGDESWRGAAYRETKDLFDTFKERRGGELIAQAFRDRLRATAGFKHVPDPMPMRNSTGAIVYYLFFAAQKPVAQRIVTDIFKKYEDRGPEDEQVVDRVDRVHMESAHRL